MEVKTSLTCFGWVTRTTTQYVMEPSDGFIAKGSQVGAKTATWNPTTVEARGVNHMEMGTHPLTEQILRRAWDGLHGPNQESTNPFFISR